MTNVFENLNMDGADVWYCSDFFSDHHIWYDMIDNSVSWTQFMIMLYGKNIPQPRDSFYMADMDSPYKYSGIDRKPDDWTVSLKEMKKIVNSEIKKLWPEHPSLNGCLGNRYKNGHQHISSHSDDESDLAPNTFIVSVSLGAERDFIFTHKKTKEKVQILLKSGSILLMGGDCQKNWKHGLPKRLRVTEPRINLTFRSILTRE
jgi:alkylated DNA repair dioxygenase AlkB